MRYLYCNSYGVIYVTGPPQSPTMQLTANQVLQRHYLGFAEGFVMVYDTTRPESLDVLMYLKKDIDRNKDKKEVRLKLNAISLCLSMLWHVFLPCFRW